MAVLPRRDFLALGTAAAAAALLPGRAFATIPTGVKLHGLSAFGDLRYAADFKHFDYVNPDAPKGGQMNFAPPNSTLNQSFLTFNTLNSLVLKGDSPPRTELCFDSLMASALDEPDAVYGLLAESVTLSQDRNGFRFSLRPQARFNDGSPLTAEDVVFALKLYKDKGHPNLSKALRHMTEAVAVDPVTVNLTFNGEQSAQNILSVVAMPIVSKAFYTTNEFDASTMKPPLGSGPYKIGRVAAGQTVEYERVADYWGSDLAVNRGLYNFDRIRIDFYLDRQAAFEAFKKGDTHFREEATARVWATGYDFPALKDGKVVKREFPGEKSPSMQAVALNQRRPQFRDVRVRRAIANCFDFEWIQRVLFFDSYERSHSNFERSDYKAEGLPSPGELALLEPFRAELPPETFGEAVMQPVSDGSGHDRKLLGAASKLLAEAGWKRAGNFVVNEKGERLRVEMLAEEDGLVRIFTPWAENMKAIGIDASIRQVDSTQYEKRQSDFDFGFNMLAWSIGATPTADGLEILYDSRMAKTPGQRNYPGTESPAIDALIVAAGKAGSRIELVTALRALDRVLRARLDWIPTYYLANHRVAYWDMFDFPEQKPDYGFPVETLWWFDKGKAAKIGKG
ncbi:putative oligopeptide transporter subunit; periplasmic-binding component of ABC superfamily transporter [Mesorhizobium metallidurans STM 2683]|uniref:Putative oligopeptide transporter subunit periplasmic-binding component of ABC superfamily transporter n=1 Tax=Mesorhizobium metallidurans STM 2683 TaxID=1297569 RepID=M5EG97_9HYPH|nr:extracellular solute-binding protein [Mesorhizobium metallidurans]CCV03280.1 putative oligopeptide transporter subunit; periplasmic-binding component of ABC superfamily transporter [Mesorhizobium metallidurans STM 2683]